MTRATGQGPSAPVARLWPAAGAVAVLIGWTTLLAASAALLHGVGGALAPPPLTEPGQLGRWLEQRQPAEAAVAVVRLAALGLAWYLLVVTIAGTLARAAGVRSLVRAADAVTLPVVRRLVHAAAGFSLAAAAVCGAGGAALAGERAGPPATSAAAAPETMRRLPGGAPAHGERIPPSTTTVPAGRAAGAGTSPAPTMRRLPAAPVERRADPATTTTAATDAPVPGPGDAPPPSSERTWRVQPGDHFWAVAEAALAEAWQRAPSDPEVDPYWRTLVDVNVAVLRDPTNPDLLFPDQVITVPAPPPPPATPGG